MSETNIRLLEDRIGKVIARLRDLSAERGRFERELSDTKSRLNAVEKTRLGRPGDSDREDLAPRVRDIRRLLRESIEELRGE